MCLPPVVTFRFLFGVFVSVGLLLVYRGCILENFLGMVRSCGRIFCSKLFGGFLTQGSRTGRVVPVEGDEISAERVP